MHAIVSIHDVMPSTIDCVRRIIDRLPETCREELILLVVPGLDWRTDQIDQLRSWQQQGICLAGHGWTHEVRHIKGWYHRLHSLLLSRRAAEHLSLTATEIEALMRRNHCWFNENGLAAPDYYVPPAWALGPLSLDQLQQLPWRYLETTSRVIDIESGQTRWLPLVGFEADTRLRQFLLSLLNRANAWLASETRPLRISIHPFDYEYLMAGQLDALVARVDRGLSVESAFINA